MDVLRGDKEWRDKGSDSEVTKGVVKQAWDIFFCVPPNSQTCPHPKSVMAYPQERKKNPSIWKQQLTKDEEEFREVESNWSAVRRGQV